MHVDMPSAAELRAEFSYDPATGAITRIRDGSAAFATLHGGGYLTGKWRGRCLKAHRVAWKLHYGVEPMVIDHINGDITDNRIENLRSVTQSDNQRNRKTPSNNTSGVQGVRWHARDKRWRATIRLGGSAKYLGEFRAFGDAVAARRRAEAENGFMVRV